MKKVLIAPLDWGLGHSTRCIPIIRQLLAKRCEVYIAGSGDALALLRLEFPFLHFFELPPYDPIYPKNGSMAGKMVLQLPKFIRTIASEHDTLEVILRSTPIDLIISDNRYGCWSSVVPSIFITHQSNILMPKRFGWLAPLVRYSNKRLMRNFSRCWIPDYPDENSLAGELISFGEYDGSIKTEYIGSLSRLTPCSATEKKIDVTVICSGPEPQRSVLEDLMKKELASSGLKFFLVKGLIQPPTEPERAGMGETVNFLTGDQLQHIACQSEYIVARSGYSTVMDMKRLGAKFICIPTPGQTEQEYLARRLKEKGIAFFMPQHEFTLKKALKESEKYRGFSKQKNDDSLLINAIDYALNL